MSGPFLRAVAMLTSPLLLACASRPHNGFYSPPHADEPQAVVEVRTRYVPTPANKVVEWLALNGDQVPGLRRMEGGYTRNVAVRPGPAAWVLKMSLFNSHVETRMMPVVSSFVCGPNGVMCSTTTMVQGEVEVDDPVAVCRTSTAHDVVAGERYVLQFDFLGNEHCEVACSRQPAGATSNEAQPCQ
jgi:hypothetical protein